MLSSFISNNKTPKILSSLVVISLFSSANLYAHDACYMDLDASLTLNETTLEFFNPTQGPGNNKEILYQINNDHSLITRGQEVDLNDDQQALVTQYAMSIRAMMPQVRTIAIESVDLALEGVNLAFDGLLGKGNNVGAELTHELSTLRDEVAARFTVKSGITIDENGEKILGKEFEQRIESVIEKAVMNSMGSLLVAMGQKMLLSGGDNDDDLETRMDTFSETIENEMELRVEKIKQKADALCSAIVDIDQLEEQLKSTILPLANINVISTTLYDSVDDKSSM